MHLPVVLATGSSLSPTISPNTRFTEQVLSKFPDRSRPLIVYASGAAGGGSKEEEEDLPGGKGAFVSRVQDMSGGMDLCGLAVEALRGAGYTAVSELAGGYKAWDLVIRPDGRRREKGKWADQSSGTRKHAQEQPSEKLLLHLCPSSCKRREQ